MRVMGGTRWVMTRRFYKRALFDKYHTFASPGEGTGRDGGRLGARAWVGSCARASVSGVRYNRARVASSARSSAT